MRILKLAVIGALLVTSPVTAAPTKCTTEKVAAREAYSELVAAEQKVREGKTEVKRAENALELARKQAPTYDADLAAAQAKLAQYAKDLDACRKRAKSNACTMQESHYKYGKERVDDLLANPPATRIANAEARLAAAQVALSHAEELELAAEIVKKAAGERLAKCQKTFA